MLKSTWTSPQFDQGLRCPLIEFSPYVQYIGEQRRPWSDCADAQSDLGILCLFTKNRIFPSYLHRHLWGHLRGHSGRRDSHFILEDNFPGSTIVKYHRPLTDNAEVFFIYWNYLRAGTPLKFGVTASRDKPKRKRKINVLQKIKCVIKLILDWRPPIG